MSEAEEAARKHPILTEIFAVHPRVIVDALVVAANEHLYVLGTQLEEQVRARIKGASEADAERDAERVRLWRANCARTDAIQGVHAIMTLLEHAIDHTMDTFELYCLRSIFVITPEQTRLMTLEHHRGLDLRPAEARRPEQRAEQPRDGDRSADVVPAYKDTLRRRMLGVSKMRAGTAS